MMSANNKRKRETNKGSVSSSSKKNKQNADNPDLEIFPLDDQRKDLFAFEEPLLGHPGLLGVLAPIGAGKSTLLINMLINPKMYRGFFDKIYIWSKTMKLDEKWEKHIDLPSDQLFDHYDDAKLKQILEDQKNEIESKGKDNSKKLLFIWDDMVADNNAFEQHRKNSVTELVIGLRHHNASMWIVSQKYTFIPTWIRNQYGAMASFHADDKTEREKIIEEKAGFMDKKEFAFIYDWVTAQPFCFLYVNFTLPHDERVYRCFQPIPPEILEHARTVFVDEEKDPLIQEAENNEVESGSTDKKAPFVGKSHKPEKAQKRARKIGKEETSDSKKPRFSEQEQTKEPKLSLGRQAPSDRSGVNRQRTRIEPLRERE